MAWTDPNVSWLSSDAVANTDFERIEKNIQHRQYVASGTIGGDSGIGAITGIVASIPIVITPTGSTRRVTLHRASWWIYQANTSLKVKVNVLEYIGTATGAGVRGGRDEDVDFTLLATSGSFSGTLDITGVFHSGGNWQPGDSWMVSYSIT